MDLKTALSTISILKDREWAYKKLDGWSNHTYLLHSGDKHCVLRLPVEAVAPWIDRKAELEHIKQLQGLELTPKTVYFDPKTGVQVRQFMNGETLPEEGAQFTDQQITDMAGALKRLHESELMFKPVDIFEIVQNSFETVEPLATDMRYMSLKQYTLQIAQMKPLMVQKPCHMDPTPHNFLQTKQGIKLLDFEYSGASDPTWDLAYAITHAGFSEAQQATLLAAYGVNEEQAHFVELLKPVTQFLQAIWILLQFHVKHFPVDEATLKAWETRALDNAFGMLF